MKTPQRGDSTIPHHLEDDDLIAYLDGEMTGGETDKARIHLESCWGCRTRLNEVQSSIESFLRVRQEALLPEEMPPSGPALELFRARLASHVSAQAQHSLLRRKVADWSAVLHSFAFPRFFGRSLVVPSYIRVRLVVSLFAIAIIAVVFLYTRQRTVSASELLQRAGSAQLQSLQATSQPVIHQRLRIKHRSSVSPAARSIDFEIWNDATTSRFRRALSDHPAGKQVLASEGATLFTDLENVLQQNQMDPRQPLSPRSYESWRGSLASKHEEITRSIRPDGFEIFTLKTVAGGAIGVGSIAEGSFVVRAHDWHPIEQYLRIRGQHGDEEYELSETSFEVVSLSTLSPTFFGDNQIAAAPTPGLPTSANPIPSSSPSSTETTPGLPPRQVATADLEVEILRLMNQSGANLGEQISVTRTSEGKLYVQGIVETSSRKQEILKALETVINHPVVIVQINTVAEVVKPGKNSARSITVPGGQISEQATIPAYSQLRSYFVARGVSNESIDDSIRQLSNRLLGISRQSLRHAWALKNLSNRFTQNDMKTLSPEARVKWLQMIQQHAQAIQQETRTLRQELDRIFVDAAPSGGKQTGAINTEAELANVLGQLVELCSSNDGAMREAFTVSSSGAGLSNIQNRQFWQTLKSAEDVSSRIQVAARKFIDLQQR